MSVSKSELHLRQARATQNPEDAISAYMRAIEEAVRELKAAPIARSLRQR